MIGNSETYHTRSPSLTYADSMRVLVDCTQVTRQKAGVGVYALNLVKALVKHLRHDVIIWLLVQDDDVDFLAFADRITLFRVPALIFRFLPFRLILEQLYIPWLTRKHKIDVVHSLHYSFPLVKTRAKRIVTIHDLTSFLMPEVHTRIKLIYFRFFIRAASRLADGLIFVSRSTQTDWLRFFPHGPSNKFVTPLGKSAMYSSNLQVDAINETRRRYKLELPYLLYIGTIEPRKNLTRLVRAFAQLVPEFPAYTLVIVGAKGWMYKDLFREIVKLGLECNVIFAGFVLEEDKPYLIAGSEVFVYPSLYEGFGIPVLEALACGTPTLTSNRSSLPEVAENAALLVDPENIDDIVFHLKRLLVDSELRGVLRARSIVRASYFSWERTANETLRAYQSMQP